MPKKKLTQHEKYVLVTAAQCVAIYMLTIGVIRVLGRTQTQPYED